MLSLCLISCDSLVTLAQRNNLTCLYYVNVAVIQFNGALFYSLYEIKHLYLTANSHSPDTWWGTTLFIYQDVKLHIKTFVVDEQDLHPKGREEKK